MNKPIFVDLIVKYIESEKSTELPVNINLKTISININKIIGIKNNSEGGSDIFVDNNFKFKVEQTRQNVIIEIQKAIGLDS